MTALGVLCCFALFVCLTLLASFFLPSHLSFKNMYIHCMYMYVCVLCVCVCVCVWLQVRQKNVSDWQKAGLVEEVLQTTARPETLHPIWNEHFELYVIACSITLFQLPLNSRILLILIFMLLCVFFINGCHRTIKDPKEDMLVIEVW